MWACKFYNTNKTIILPWYWLWLSVLSHIKYHTCQCHVNCHFVSCIVICGWKATCQEAGMQHHQREWTSWCTSPKNVKPVLQCRERLTKGSCHIWQSMASTVPSPTAKLVRRHHIRMSSSLHSTLVASQSDRHGSQCTHHKYCGVCHDATHSTTGITSLGWHSNTWH